MQEGQKCLHGAGKKRQIAFREGKVMKFGKAGTGIAAAAVALSMLSSMPVFASSELNFGTGFTPQTVTVQYSSGMSQAFALNGYNQSPELFFVNDSGNLFNNVCYDGCTVTKNKKGLVTKVVNRISEGEDGPTTDTTTYKYNKKGDLLSMNQKTVADEDHTEIANETIVFHYNKDYTLNYISGSDENGMVMTCEPERDENGTIFGFDYEDNYGYKLYTLIYNPDGTIASMALAQSSAGVGYSTQTYNFVYDNGRLAAYQEVSDYPVTYVFGY